MRTTRTKTPDPIDGMSADMFFRPVVVRRGYSKTSQQNLNDMATRRYAKRAERRAARLLAKSDDILEAANVAASEDDIAAERESRLRADIREAQRLFLKNSWASDLHEETLDDILKLIDLRMRGAIPQDEYSKALSAARLSITGTTPVPPSFHDTQAWRLSSGW